MVTIIQQESWANAQNTRDSSVWIANKKLCYREENSEAVSKRVGHFEAKY